MNSFLNVDNYSVKENIFFEQLQDSTSDKDLNSIKSLIKGGQNLIISGTIGAGKTTVMEAVIREHLTSVPTNKNLYLPLAAEMNFKDENILTLERFSNGRTIEISKQLIVAHAFGVQTVFVEELRSEADYMAVLEALDNNTQIIFTMHAQDVETALNRINGYIGEELGKRFISKFNHVVSCKRDHNGKRSFTITGI